MGRVVFCNLGRVVFWNLDDLGRVVLGRLFYGPSCPGPTCLWAELSWTPLRLFAQLYAPLLLFPLYATLHLFYATLLYLGIPSVELLIDTVTIRTDYRKLLGWIGLGKNMLFRLPRLKHRLIAFRSWVFRSISDLLLVQVKSIRKQWYKSCWLVSFQHYFGQLYFVYQYVPQATDA